MNFNVNLGTQSHKNTHTIIPPRITRYESVSDSIESDGPLAKDTPKNSQGSVKQYTRSPQGTLTPNDRPKLAVVLNKPPGHYKAYKETSVEYEEDEFDAPVTSDLTSQGKPETLLNPVNAMNTSSPIGPLTAVSSDATSTNPSRKRGRPKGSSNKLKSLPATAAASRQARQVKSRPHPSGFPKRRGRPLKQPSPPPRTIYYQLDAPFFPFLCEWKGCKAELQNLETLRRHVNVVHGDSDHCLWGECWRQESPCEFGDDEHFKEHVEGAHLVPLSWHVGDGPNNLGQRSLPKEEEEDIPDYLKDEHGNQVTPSIRDQQEEDLMTWRRNRRKLKELLIRMNDNLPDGSDEEEGVERDAA
ncbi:hypothetical protein F66182_2941 [Fusarium sp. NRRL 66182]|nr:hypothetical protein F66182_2941 [Fusarium sp. NRRL 66182]